MLLAPLLSYYLPGISWDTVMVLMRLEAIKRMLRTSIVDSIDKNVGLFKAPFYIAAKVKKGQRQGKERRQYINNQQSITSRYDKYK